MIFLSDIFLKDSIFSVEIGDLQILAHVNLQLVCLEVATSKDTIGKIYFQLPFWNIFVIVAKKSSRLT